MTIPLIIVQTILTAIFIYQFQFVKPICFNMVGFPSVGSNHSFYFKIALDIQSKMCGRSRYESIPKITRAPLELERYHVFKEAHDYDPSKNQRFIFSSCRTGFF